jgi:hypothetical protein
VAGTIIVDRLESDASYASSINVASPLVVSNTINMNGGSITGNVNIDNGTLYVSQNKNTVGVGLTDPNGNIHLYAAQGNEFGHLRVETTSNASLVLVRSGVQAWSMYIDNSDSSQLKIGPSNSGVALATKYFGIDTSGRVTMPNQPCFSAHSTNGTSITTSATKRVMPYAGEITDIGSTFNTSTNRFTAPVAGTYFITYSALLLGGGSGNLGLNKNGSAVNGVNGHARSITGTNEQNMGQSVVVTLAANDYLEVVYWNDGGSNNFYGAHGSFCGYLIG